MRATGVVERILAGLTPNGTVAEVRVGALWTAVAVETAQGMRAGLASTQIAHDLVHGQPAVRDAGRLIGRPALDLAHMVAEAGSTPTERSIGLAALNALLEVDEGCLVEQNAEQLIVERGAGLHVAIVGHFPFVPRVRAAAEACWVLELSPGEDDLPADQAPAVLPQADLVAITGMTLVNGTFEPLVGLCRPEAYVLVLGATTPLSRILFDYGVDAISGTLVVDIPAVLAAVSQGANFRQLPGKRLVTMTK
jgi:uncharacterized protein (DUF4213/DUF364 family)